MQLWDLTRSLFGAKPAVEPVDSQTNYPVLMREALRRVTLAELQIKEATTLEELDIGRSAMAAAWAEVQQLVRTAKRERGIAVRPVAETEELHRRLREHMRHRGEGGAILRKMASGGD